MPRKDYAAAYQEAVQADWLSDLSLLWYPFRDAVLTAFRESDSTMKDIQVAHDQFCTAVLAYVDRGIELDMTEYLQSGAALDSPVPLMMSAADNPEKKAARAASHAKLTKAAPDPDAINDLALVLTLQNAARGL